MVEPTEVLVELKQVKKQLKQSKEVYVFLFAIICYYVLLFVFMCCYYYYHHYYYCYMHTYIHMFSHFFNFLVCFSMLSYSLLFFGTWCGEHTSGEGASSHK